MCCGSVHAVRKNSEVLLITSKEFALEVNDEKNKNMVMSLDQNSRRNGNIKLGSEWFERVE
jgi:hypothetical protein